MYSEGSTNKGNCQNLAFYLLMRDGKDWLRNTKTVPCYGQITTENSLQDHPIPPDSLSGSFIYLAAEKSHAVDIPISAFGVFVLLSVTLRVLVRLFAHVVDAVILIDHIIRAQLGVVNDD